MNANGQTTVRATLRAVIFDFDGLIVDTESAAFAAWSAIYAEHGAVLELSRWVACVGASEAVFDPVAHLGELTGRVFDSERRRDLIADKEARKAERTAGLSPLPGVLERLDEASRLGLKVAVASSSGAAYVKGHLRRLGLHERFTVIRSRDDVARVKPHPDLPVSAARGLGVEPAQCLVLEDSLNGVLAAKAAGARCFAIPNDITRNLDFHAADGVFDSLLAVTFAGL